MKRRTFVKVVLATPFMIAAAPTRSCRPGLKDLTQLPLGGSADLPIVIDTHAHIFNASDLQVSKFITQVAGTETDGSAVKLMADLFGPVLQKIGWHLAPSARTELRRLTEYQPAEASRRVAHEAIGEARRVQYTVAKNELDRAAREVLAESSRSASRLAEPLESLVPADQALASLLQLPDAYEELHGAGLEEAFGLESALGASNALRKFLVEMFQYRHVSAVNYFDTYSSDQLAVDLLTPCMVDYDWWLSKGRSTKSTLPQQIAVNERIAAMSGGRIHPLVPFDPFKQVMWDKHGVGDYSPLDLVADALEHRGFIGVKLYPPMGFAMHANARFAGRSSQIWGDKDWLNQAAKHPNFGAELDRALDRLYSYCAANEVAIMAHSSRSNMAHIDFEPLLLAESWRSMYDDHDVVASFGHFSGFGSGSAEGHWREFVRLLLEDTNSSAPKRYADASYFSDVIRDSENVVARLRTILFDTNGQPTSVHRQLVYGSDWKMLLMEPGSRRYMDSMVAVLKQADVSLIEAGFASDLQTRVMGLNAANYLGLRSGRRTRARLETFYAKWNVASPLWMQKIDAVPPQEWS